MLKRLSDKPAPSHTRAKTLACLPAPHCNPTSASSLLEDDFQDVSLTLTPPCQPLDSLSRPTTIPRMPTKTHQRSLTEHLRPSQDLPPLLDCSSQSEVFELSGQSSPTRTKRIPLSLFTGEQDSNRTQERAGKLAKWFEGESEPIRIGLLPSPTKEIADPLDTKAVSSIRPSSLLQRKSTNQMASRPATMASKFSFFSSKVSLSKPCLQPSDQADQLLDLDITTAFPPPHATEPTSPAGLRSIQQKAENIFLRMRNAYRECGTSLREMNAEKETLVEEAQGAETRAKHLKMQLDEVAVKLAEQDEAMMNLVDELAQEKLARQEETDARLRSIRLVERDSPSKGHRQFRRSETSDSGFESEDDSYAESVFSRANGTHSPTISISSMSTNSSPDAMHVPELYHLSLAGQAARLRSPATLGTPKGRPPMSRLDHLSPTRQSSCANYEGARASEAWDVVTLLNEENQALKRRVGELEGALDGCLDVVNRLA